MCTASTGRWRIRRDKVALPFCQITLTAQKPLKIPKNLKTLGDHIRKHRIEIGLFQKDVACILGVDECSIYHWENNRCEPQLRYLPRIIKFLGYEPEIFTGETLGERLKRY